VIVAAIGVVLILASASEGSGLGFSIGVALVVFGIALDLMSSRRN
jgi:flagellar motor component MotA